MGIRRELRCISFFMSQLYRNTASSHAMLRSAVLRTDVAEGQPEQMVELMFAPTQLRVKVSWLLLLGTSMPQFF